LAENVLPRLRAPVRTRPVRARAVSTERQPVAHRPAGGRRRDVLPLRGGAAVGEQLQSLHLLQVLKCRRFEVPASPAANSSRNFKSTSGTSIIYLLVPLCFRSSCQGVLRCITNFGSGALARCAGSRSASSRPSSH